MHLKSSFILIHVTLYNMQDCLTLICILTDINECDLELHDCDQLCTNTPGSYMCSCLPGFFSLLNGSDCQGGYTWLG